MTAHDVVLVINPDTLARALHDADCGCDTYDEIEDPRYIDAVHTALRAVKPQVPPGGCGHQHEALRVQPEPYECVLPADHDSPWHRDGRMMWTSPGDVDL